MILHLLAKYETVVSVPEYMGAWGMKKSVWTG